MPQPVNAGSVLGGRYKVTAQVLASAESDLVLDGVDQVLNRAVSILVAAPQNASQVSASVTGHSSSKGVSIQSRISPNRERCSR